jgi:hypothetical protein
MENISFKLSWVNHLSIYFIKIYQNITRKRKHKCLHYPTCSNYAILALEKYPFKIAIRMIILRLKDCNPYSSRHFFDYP